MSHKSVPNDDGAAQDFGSLGPRLAAPQVEFARMLGAVLAALWVIEPNSASPPAPQPPFSEQKNNRNLSPEALTGFPG